MKFLRLLLVPFAGVVVIAIRLLARFGILIRFGKIFSGRIGHMAGNMECYLCEKDAGMSSGFDFWYHHGSPCNKALAKMIGRVIRIDRTGFVSLCSLVNQLFEGWEKYQIDTVQVDRDIHNLMEKQQPHLQFTAREEARGEAQLREWGLPEGAKWVCLIVRDSAYLPTLGYHSYRDCDVDSYYYAAEMLAMRGYYTFRMGAKVQKKWKGAVGAMLIDYATNGMRSDFMDVYLGAKCEFCISSGCGFDAIPVIFRRPVVYTNYVPVEYLLTFNAQSLAIWKHHFKDGKKMSFQEIVKSGAGQFMQAGEFEQAGITLKDNSPEEIRDVALEHVERSLHTRTMTNYWREMYSPEEEEKQAEFWKAFPKPISPYNNKPLHGEIRMRIGREFLKCEASS